GNDISTEIITVGRLPVSTFSVNQNTGCAPANFQMVNTSTNEPTAYLWLFPGGTPATSTEPNPGVSYSTAGNYNVTLIATNELGADTMVMEGAIQVSNNPVIDFSVQVNDQQIETQNGSQYANEVLWNFGDGNTSNEKQPSHTYAQAGNYTITLTITNDCGSVNESQDIVIGNLPVSQFENSALTGCAPLAVAFTSTALNNPTSVQWVVEGVNTVFD